MWRRSLLEKKKQQVRRQNADLIFDWEHRFDEHEHHPRFNRFDQPHKEEQAEWISEMIGIRATTPKACSLHCCGNPRKWYKRITKQEARNLLSFKEQLLELEVPSLSNKIPNRFCSCCW